MYRARGGKAPGKARLSFAEVWSKFLAFLWLGVPDPGGLGGAESLRSQRKKSKAIRSKVFDGLF